MSVQTMPRTTLSVKSPTMVVVLHNLSLVYHVMQDHKKAARCQSQLAHLLRLACAKHQYEVCYIKLLTMQSKVDPTAVAA